MEEYFEDDELYEVTNKSNVSFKQMLHRKDLSDITLSCGERKFQVHRMLLAACSPYFRFLLRKRPTKLLNVVIENVSADDLERVLHYMYHGSIMLTDKHIQGFCEVLEMFMMSLPNNIIVSSSESESETESQAACDFVEEVREMLNDLHKERLADQSSSILALTDMNEDKLISLIKMILQLLLQIKKTSTHTLLFSLVEHLCLKNGCKGFRDDTAFFREKLRMESLHLLATLCKIDVQNKNKPSNCNEHDGINSLDHQVNCIETIRYHCAPLRMQRLKHFVYHLFSIDVITPGNILDISKNNPSLGADLIVKPHSNTRSGNCCDTELPSVVKKMMQNKWYQSLQPIEEKMFWTRIEGIKQSEATLAFAKNMPVKRTTKYQRRAARRKQEKLLDPEKFAKKEAKRKAKKARRKLRKIEKAKNIVR